MQDHEIVGVSDAVFYFQFPFEKMIELVHVNVHQKLAGEITEWQTDTGLTRSMEAPHDFPEESDDILIFDSPFQNTVQNPVIYSGEKFSDITFQNPNCAGMIVRNLPRIFAEAIYRPVCAFDAATRIGIEDKLGIKIRIQNSVDGMMQKPIPDGGLVNIPRFGVVDAKRRIGSMTIGFVY